MWIGVCVYLRCSATGVHMIFSDFYRTNSFPCTLRCVQFKSILNGHDDINSFLNKYEDL